MTCRATMKLGQATLFCNRPLTAMHYRHEYRRKGEGYKIIITWMTPRPARESKIRQCGKCRQLGHNRRRHDREAA